MSMLLQLIRNVDIIIYHFLNGFAGNRLLNYFASFEENDRLLKGGLFLALYWYLWFRPGSDQDKRRKAIIAIMAGALFAVIACRVIADLGPFRIRPMYDLHLQHHPYISPLSPNLVNWSAFPSDTAAYFFALAFGIARLSRRLAVPAMLYAAGWICFPRLFLGEHYASDVVVGASIGIVAVWVSSKVEWLQSGLATRLLALVEAKPEVFYPAAFITSFEMGVIFEDLRAAARTVFDLGRAEHGAYIALIAFATLSLLVIAAFRALPARHEMHARRFIELSLPRIFIRSAPSLGADGVADRFVAARDGEFRRYDRRSRSISVLADLPEVAVRRGNAASRAPGPEEGHAAAPEEAQSQEGGMGRATGDLPERAASGGFRRRA
jgi:membrane-associated phospholipid phosphatase